MRGRAGNDWYRYVRRSDCYIVGALCFDNVHLYQLLELPYYSFELVHFLTQVMDLLPFFFLLGSFPFLVEETENKALHIFDLIRLAASIAGAYFAGLCRSISL